MIDVRDIYSLSDFQRKTREHIRRLKRTGRPEVLTVNGKAALVVQAAGAYGHAAETLTVREAPSADPPRGEDPALDPDPVIEAYKKHVDRTLLRENLRRSVDERLAALLSLQRLADEARRAGQAARASLDAP